MFRYFLEELVVSKGRIQYFDANCEQGYGYLSYDHPLLNVVFEKDCVFRDVSPYQNI